MTVNNMSSMLRISGIASGLDTDSMVKSLMKIEQLRVDQVLRQKTKLEWARDMRQDINKQINDLRYSYASVLSNKNLNIESAFKVHSVDMSDNSAVSISASSSAGVGSHTIDSITQLASSAQVNSASRVSTENLDRSDTLETISAQLDTALTFDVNGQISFKINDQTFTFDKTTTLDSMLRTVNNSDAGVNIDL
jgi:flagellar hook-associated protein 2